MPLRTLIVDDEPVARDRLRLLLADEPDVEIVGEAESGGDAIRLIRRHDPDLVLLDIRMPDGDGFDVIDGIGPERMPRVVFVTAYDEHAIRAFEINAVDYLLKPFDRERLAAALARVRSRKDRSVAAERGERLASLADLLADRGGTGAPRRLAVRDGGRIRFVDTDAIDWAESAGNYVKVHAGDETHVIRHTLSGLVERLDPGRFIRIHRSALVNLDRVVEMRHWSSGEYIVELEDGTELKLSRTYREKVLARLEGDDAP